MARLSTLRIKASGLGENFSSSYLPPDQGIIRRKIPIFLLIWAHARELGRHFLLVTWELLVEESGSPLCLETAAVMFIAGAG